MDRELLTKASHSAGFLADDLQAIYTDAANPLLPELVADVLTQARAMADKLARLALMMGGDA